MSVLFGWRVKDTSTGKYVRQTDDYVHREYRDNCPPEVSTFNSDEPGPVLSRPDALRLLAHWLECGYVGHMVKVMRPR